MNKKQAELAHALTVLDGSFFANANESYWSEEDLKHRPLPGGVSPEGAWQAVSLMRRLNLKPVDALRGVDGRSFHYMLTERAVQLMLRIEALARDPFGVIGEGLAASTESLGMEGLRREVIEETLMEESIQSSLLEGAATTRKVAQQMLIERRPPRNVGERMIWNSYRTMSLVLERLGQPLTPKLVLELHACISRETLDSAADEGRLQSTDEERVVVVDVRSGPIHHPPPASELEERLRRLCDFANATEPYLPPVVRATFLHFQLGHDHPFVDGNGRTARALFYWAMLRAGYDVFRFLTISKALNKRKRQYPQAFVLVEGTGDLTYFLLFHLRAVETALAELQALLRAKVGQRRRSQDALRHWKDLNARQRGLLARALVDADYSIDASEYMRSFDCTRPTALVDLKALVGHGLLTQSRSGRAIRFWRVADLAQRLELGPRGSRRDA